MQSIQELKVVIDTTFEDISESFGLLGLEERRSPSNIMRFINNVEAFKGQLSRLQEAIKKEASGVCKERSSDGNY